MIVRLCAVALLSLTALPAQDLPEGPGKDLFANVCSSCHPLDYSTKKRLSASDWKAMVNTMATRGAAATRAELDTITAYLVKNYPAEEGAASPGPAAAASKEMPEGQGKQIILRECTACHLPDHFTKYLHTPEEWQAIVIRMGTRVRAATKDELDTVTKYLATNYPKVEVAGRVNVNKAKAADLQSQFSLTAEEADAVVKYRERHGEFREWGELLAIYGVDGRKIEAAKDRMSF
jgi:competence ComEA-like helix-hairpin-helix protein